MRIKWIVLGLTVIYVAAMIAGYFTVPAYEPKFDVPEYIKFNYGNDETRVHIYEKKSKYYIEYPLADEKYELTREEYIRCTAINPDNFKLNEEYKQSSYPVMSIEIKYPDKKAKEYDVYDNGAFTNPCWQLLWLRTIKYGDRKEEFGVVNALEQTFDKYRIENGAFLSNGQVGMSRVFYYGDVMKVLYGKEDCFDEDVYYKLMAELCMMDLYQEGLIDEKDFTDDFEKMCDVIEDTTDHTLEQYMLIKFASNIAPLYDKKNKTSMSDLLFYLTYLAPRDSSTLEEEYQEKILEDKYIYTDKYEIEGYYRVIEDDEQMIILCISPEDKLLAVVVAESSDPLTKRGFINSVVETIFDEKDEGPSGNPYETTHKLARAVVITAVFIFLLAVLLVVSFIRARKKKKAEVLAAGNAEDKPAIEPASAGPAASETPATQPTAGPAASEVPAAATDPSPSE